MAGAVLGGVGASARLNPNALAASSRAAAPTLDELTAAKNAAYQAVDNSGVRYTPDAMKGLAGDINTALGQARYNPNLHTKAGPVLDQIANDVNSAAGYSPSLTELDQLRRQVRDAVAMSSDKDERRIGGVILGRIDGFINSAGPDQVTGAGDPTQAAALIQRARNLNARVEKLRSLDNLDEAAVDRAAATGTGSNTGNALRQNMIRFQNDTGNLTPAEQDAVRAAIRGNPVQNALREVGSFSPEGGTVRAGASIFTGAMSHGAIPAAGFVAKRVSDAMAERSVQKLRDIIASGGGQEVADQLAATPGTAGLQGQLADDLALRGIVNFRGGLLGAVRGTAQPQPQPAR
jgi:hypothetical protein